MEHGIVRMWKSDEGENVSLVSSNGPRVSRFGEFSDGRPCHDARFGIDGHPVNRPAVSPLAEIEEET